MSIGIPSEKLSMRSFTALATSVFSTAAMVALEMGMNGAALILVVANTSSRVSDQRMTEKK